MKSQKVRTVILLVLLIIIALSVYGIVSPSEKDNTSETSNIPKTQNQQSGSEPSLEPESTDKDTQTPESTVETESVSESTEPLEKTSEEEIEHRTGDEIIGVSNKDIFDLNPVYYESVTNDTTGNWRLVVISEDVDIQDYIYSYYQEYYKNNNEIHGIVNLSKGITTRINYVSGMLIVTELNYVEGEEHDAKLLYSGDPLKSYIVYTDNGDIEKAE